VQSVMKQYLNWPGTRTFKPLLYLAMSFIISGSLLGQEKKYDFDGDGKPDKIKLISGTAYANNGTFENYNASIRLDLSTTGKNHVMFKKIFNRIDFNIDFSVEDYDNDGDLDIIVSGYDVIEMPLMSGYKGSYVANKVPFKYTLENDGTGFFSEVSILERL